MPAIITDNPEVPDDLDPTTGEIEWDIGSTQKPAEAPEEDLNNQEVGIDTEPSQHLQNNPWEESPGQEIDIDNPGYPDLEVHDSQPEVQIHQEPEEQSPETQVTHGKNQTFKLSLLRTLDNNLNISIFMEQS